MKRAKVGLFALTLLSFALQIGAPASAQEQGLPPSSPVITKDNAALLDAVAGCNCGAAGEVRGIALSPDGHTLALSSTTGVLRLWDIERDELRLEVDAVSPALASLAFSPDGALLAAGAGFTADALDYSAMLWNAETGEAERTISTFSDPIFAVAFSADGQYLAVGSGDPFLGPGDYQVWDMEQFQRETVFHPLGGPPADPVPLSVQDLVFNPRSGLLAAATGDGAVRLFDPRIDFGAELAVLPAEGDWRALSLAFSPDGRRLAAAGGASTCGWNQVCAPEDGEGAILIWRMADETISGRLAGMIGPVWTVAFSPDGRLLASAGFDGLRLWDVEQAELLAHLAAGESGISTVAFSPDGSALLTGHANGSVQVWRVPPA